MRYVLFVCAFCLFACTAFAAEPELYKLSVEKGAIKAGKGVVTIKVHKVEGRKINLEFPSKLLLKPSETVIPAKSEIKGADFATKTESDLAVAVPFELKGPGVLEYTLKFGTCEVENGQVKNCSQHAHSDKIELKP